MNEITTNDVAAELLTWMQAAHETVTEQAPILCDEILHQASYGYIAGGICLFLCLSVAGVSILIGMYAIRKDAGMSSNWVGVVILVAIGGGIACLCLCIGGLQLLYTAFSAAHWPRLYIIDYLSRYIQ